MKDARVNNLGGLLTRTARLFPSHHAVIAEGKSWTWKEVDQRVQAMASALKNLGIAKGDRILVLSRNNLQLFESSWVSFRMGCVWVPTNFRLTPPEVAYLASSSGAKVMIYQKGFEDHAKRVLEEADSLKFLICIGDDQGDYQDYESMIESHLGQEFKDETVKYDDPLWFFYTSGTTGRTKAGVLTHGQMNFVVNNHLADLIPGTTEQDVLIAVAPLSHGAGVHMLLNVARGASLVLMPGNKMDPELFWQLVERHRVSNLFTVPTIVKMLVEHESVDRYDHSSLRYMIYAGAPMYRADQKKALEKLGQVMVQYYGMGEVTGCITYLPTEMHSIDDEDPNANIGSCGIPRTGME
ncbi:MAG: AMP-binding protein, partial [SAR324 cluster bacterium]|nr:AMP-binding protein [SAR324 cluster bacterium]